MSAVDAHGLRTAADQGMELQVALDEACARIKRLLLGEVSAILDALADAQRGIRDHTGRLDEMARAAHHSVPDGEPNPLTVRAIVRALRDPLAVLADPGAHTAAAFVNASTSVRSVIDQVPAHKLLSNSVRVQLGGARHDLLAKLIADDARELTA